MPDLKHQLIMLRQRLEAAQAAGQVPASADRRAAMQLITAPALAAALSQGGAAVPSGDGLVRPVNAPPAGAVGIGVQPGTSNGVVLARYVIVTGAGGGVFVYSGQPGPGNPPIAWMGGAGADPFGNPLSETMGLSGSGTFGGSDWLITPAGYFFYSPSAGPGNLVSAIVAGPGTDPYGNSYGQFGPGNYVYGSNKSFAALVNNSALAELILGGPGLIHASNYANVVGAATNAGLANERQWLVLSSGKESGNADAAVQLIAESADGTIPAEMIVEFGGTQTFTVSPTGLFVTGMASAVLEMFPSAATQITFSPEFLVQVVNAGAANERLLAVLTSGKDNGKSDAAIQCYSQSGDGTLPAQVVIEFGGTVAGTYTATGLLYEAWNIGAPINGWANSGGGIVSLRYRKVASPANSVEVIGGINGASATSNQFFQLPAGYRPTSIQMVPGGSTTTSQTAWVECDASGILSLQASTFANRYMFHGFISLDA